MELATRDSGLAITRRNANGNRLASMAAAPLDRQGPNAGRVEPGPSLGFIPACLNIHSQQSRHTLVWLQTAAARRTAAMQGTTPGRGLFAWSGIYGPEQPASDGTRKLGDVEEVR